MKETDHKSRRQCLLYGCDSLLLLPIATWAGALLRGAGPSTPGFRSDGQSLPEAMFWEKGEGQSVHCRLCFRSCRISAGERGYCGVRINVDGMLRTLVFGKMGTVTHGPVEKKPLHHFLPGALACNFGTAGCNLNCRFCHNWHLSQRKPEELDRYEVLTPKDAVERAKGRHASVVSFTYNEPTTFYEFMLRTAELARESGIKVNVNTNALMQEVPLRTLMKPKDSATVDLKAFDETFYRNVCEGSLAPVLKNISTMMEMDVWVEIVNLVIPGLNDHLDMIRDMCRWICSNAGPDTPMHFNRFVPAYRLTNIQPTPVRTLERARQVAVDEGLNYVYIGNVPGHVNNSTFCGHCGERIIHRVHFSIRAVNMKDGRCGACDHPIAGVWDGKWLP